MKAYRYSDGSYLEGQDYWKYSGIERSVSLTARPASRVEDFEISAPLVNSYRDGDFSLRLKMDSPTKGERVDVALSSAATRYGATATRWLPPQIAS